MTPTELSQVKHLLAVTSEVCDELFAPDEDTDVVKLAKRLEEAAAPLTARLDAIDPPGPQCAHGAVVNDEHPCAYCAADREAAVC